VTIATAAPRTVTIGRAQLACVSISEAVDRVLELVTEPRATLVVTANSDHIVRLETDDALLAAYRAADLAVIDGQPLLWASKLTPSPAPERVAGVDLFTALCQREQADVSLFLLGGSQANNAAAARVVAETSPHVRVVGRNADRLTDRTSPAIIEQIRYSGANVVAVFLGCPKQETWVHQHRSVLPPAAYLCLGGTVDIISGSLPRASKAWQRLGLEWLHRLVLEPKRLWRRYLLDDPKFALVAARSIRQSRRAHRSRASLRGDERDNLLHDVGFPT
jgi:N-acetylglucosaminyldiphosphoundecaprenol N-acetyl-beta-D-mannosaminyltransferase